MAKEPPKAEQLLDLVEALLHIRAVVEATADQAYGTPSEAAFRMIRDLVDRAVPQRRRQRRPKE
ncbi:hypothetical protein [Methylobacterium sp. J-076]|uniref:hypothetical protein n=1 Tax=Methylobacterium sp. J-076 TaxID=2836655 RepID=UPI001FBBD4CF|nr:hypothetical protein [Methylobacterium sp. J-076]MCJ2015219.1 hypothetical protein [Methylobacterium sp. J-076]